MAFAFSYAGSPAPNRVRGELKRYPHENTLPDVGRRADAGAASNASGIRRRRGIYRCPKRQERRRIGQQKQRNTHGSAGPRYTDISVESGTNLRWRCSKESEEG